MGFRNFLLNEQHSYLSHRVGDVLTSVHELVRGGKQIGARQLVRHSQGVVNQIRKILHTSWPKTEYKYLRRLQRCGVALAKCIDEKGDLKEVLNSVRHEIEELSDKIGQPINTLGTTPEKEGHEPQTAGGSGAATPSTNAGSARQSEQPPPNQKGPDANP